ncbi:MAG TPA: carboxy terminal-processing peptidase, partial [Opitutales bacterium]|nr:carboxy terminal-processing peptidase [Opitutales bacterium]
EMRKETRSTVAYLENFHYSKIKMAQLDQRALLRAYMANLDARHLMLLQSDVTAFQDKYSPELVQDVEMLGDLSPAYDIFKQFRQDFHARVDWINKYLDGDIDLQSKDTFAPDRTDAEWPKTTAEADDLWSKQIRYDLISELLAAETREIDIANKKAADAANPPAADTATPAAAYKSAADKIAPADASTSADAKPAAPKTFAEKVTAAKDEIRKRYNTMLKTVDETDALEVQDVFLNTLAGQYDPHSTFFTENGLEGFDTQMSNVLIGIGAVLEDKDDYCVVEDLVPGGPAKESKQIQSGDKIVAVGQGDGEMVDVDGIKLNKTVSLIRGAEGSEVRLKIVPSNGSEADAKVVTLVRKKISVTTALAQAHIINVPQGDAMIPIGVIDLPAFYGKVNPGDKFSTTQDVRELIGKLKDAGVRGLVLDVRNNGGGFLNEAIDLAGLFIPPSPILGVRTVNGFVLPMKSDSATPLWDGPVEILESKQSASATEIFAGAMQDYRRALIVGDITTHGKGTVQQMYSFSNMREPTEKGAAKITMEKWYLPDGNSVQSRGVKADIALPSDIDFLPIGEGDLKNALPWDSVPALPLTLSGEGPWRSSLVDDSLVSKLHTASDSRLTSLDEMALLQKRVAWEKAREDEKVFTLNFDARMAERRNDIAIRDELRAGLEALSKKVDYKTMDIELDAAKAQDDGTPKIRAEDMAKIDDGDPADVPLNFDVQLRESARIMVDWLRFDNLLPDATSKVATTAPAAANSADPAKAATASP